MDDSDHGSVSELADPQVGEQIPQQPPADEWTVARIIAELDRDHDGTLPESAIRAAQQRRDEMIPHLINLVRSATVLVRGGDEPEGNGHLIALYLLTEFRAKEALPAIVEAMLLPGDDVDTLYGDAITEDFSRVLAVLAADAPEQIDALIVNRSLDEHVRWGVAQTYMNWVRDGRLTRAQGVEKLRQHLRGAIANEDADLASALVFELRSYGPREALEEIQEAYGRDLVDTSVICMEDVELALDEGDAHWQKSLAFCPPTDVQDTVEELQSWACYQEDDEDEDGEDDEDGDTTPLFFNRIAPLPRFLDDEPLLHDDEFHAAKSQDLPDTRPETIRRTEPRVGRNSPCPCGSGKKFKKCCAAH